MAQSAIQTWVEIADNIRSKETKCNWSHRIVAANYSISILRLTIEVLVWCQFIWPLINWIRFSELIDCVPLLVTTRCAQKIINPNMRASENKRSSTLYCHNTSCLVLLYSLD